MTTQDIIIDENMNVFAVYNDDILGILKSIGDLKIERASHVEPTENCEWEVNFEPFIGKKKIGPFKTRQKALDEEVNIIKEAIKKGELK